MTVDALDRITKLEVRAEFAEKQRLEMSATLSRIEERLRHVEQRIYIAVGGLCVIQWFIAHPPF